jgi:hypothetical protein
VNEIVRLTLIPIIAAASWSWATARMPLPCLVERTSQVRISSTGIVIRTTQSLFQLIETPPIVKAGSFEMSGGELRYSTP